MDPHESQLGFLGDLGLPRGFETLSECNRWEFIRNNDIDKVYIITHIIWAIERACVESSGPVGPGYPTVNILIDVLDSVLSRLKEDEERVHKGWMPVDIYLQDDLMWWLQVGDANRIANRLHRDEHDWNTPSDGRESYLVTRADVKRRLRNRKSRIRAKARKAYRYLGCTRPRGSGP
jgi:hypothetical protein